MVTESFQEVTGYYTSSVTFYFEIIQDSEEVAKWPGVSPRSLHPTPMETSVIAMGRCQNDISMVMSSQTPALWASHHLDSHHPEFCFNQHTEPTGPCRHPPPSLVPQGFPTKSPWLVLRHRHRHRRLPPEAMW